MRCLDLRCAALFALAAMTQDALAATKPSNSVLLSNVKTLTLRKDFKTTHRRVAAVPQLKCAGGDAKGLYEVDVMRCKNQGADYDDENIQWTCTASLPAEFKLGSTEVICEGYESSQDPYILKGSCGVEYRLLLTEVGDEKYGRQGSEPWENHFSDRRPNWVSILFWGCFVGVLGWIIYSAYVGRGRRGAGPNVGPGRGWGGGGGGGGGGGWGAPPDEPPPPYDWQPPRKTQPSSSRRPGSSTRAQGQQGWRPGPWTAAAGGAAAGYLFGQRGSSGGQQRDSLWGNGEGSSRTGGRGAGSGASSSFSSSSPRHESTGFGSTSRR